jgi:NAD(P)-dependent dehydrogenase (short-subunit alcohol dehydrogenase family)
MKSCYTMRLSNPRGMMLLDNLVVLITGASSGIGLAALRLFSDEGARVVGLARRAGAAQDVVAELTAVGRIAKFYRADITDPQQISAVVNEIEQSVGPLDAALNNASVTQDAYPIDEIPDHVFDEVLTTNIKGTWHCLRSELGVMKRRGHGAIVNVSSIAGVRGFPGLAAYTASKHAILGLTRSAALDAAAYGVRVNCLCPGTTRTPMMERQMLTRPGGEQATLARIPLGRIASAQEQAQAAAWLLSNRASFVTGEELVVDGGGTIR